MGKDRFLISNFECSISNLLGAVIPIKKNSDGFYTHRYLKDILKSPQPGEI